ncbi:MAG TPA: sigma-70 family RNA polymerase sigma factor [Gemmataceae bacterium]|nr:sigma-70 family RNA polymerase sigma factor [Gemmataceae bacterium]
MAPGSLSRLLHPVRDVAGRHAGSGTSDAALLERFVRDRDEAAFELLVWRHDRTVRGVCRQVLRREQDVEDAWQATFLTLACKARAIANRPALAGWLYKVAFRIALRARGDAAKREQGVKSAEGLDAVPASESPANDPGRNEFRAIVAEEVGRLAEKYRTPVVLCYLEGKTNEEAARQLGCPASTIATRLARARDRLRSRLARRGLGATAGAVSVALARAVGVMASPPGHLQATVNAALPFANDQIAAGLISARVATLTHEALRTMLMNRIKLIGAVVLAVCLAGGGSGLLAFRAAADEPAAPPPERGTPPAPDDKVKEKAAEKEKEKPRRELKKDGRQKVEEVVSKSFKTGNAPTVTVEVFNGGVTVVADSSGAVDAKLTKQSQATTEELAKEGLKNIEIEMKQDKDNVRIVARRVDDKDRTSQEQVSAEIRVPAGAVLNLKTSNGGVQVAGGTGAIEIDTSNGPIQVKDGKGGLKLTSRNGGIAVTGATGRVELKTSNGPIDLQAENVMATARTSNGQVRFRGSLAAGAHTFTTSNGRIALTLPAEAKFKVDATTSLGGINTDFGVGASARTGHAQLKTTVGEDPKTTITLQTNNGGIEIRKKKE